MKYYSEDHEWIEVNGSIATIGISAHAAEELGDITYVELPLEEENVEAGDAVCVVESVKAAADIYSPANGTVAEVNVTLDNQPELINKSPELEGWLYKLKGFKEEDISGLMNYDQYAEYLKKS